MAAAAAAVSWGRVACWTFEEGGRVGGRRGRTRPPLLMADVQQSSGGSGGRWEGAGETGGHRQAVAYILGEPLRHASRRGGRLDRRSRPPRHRQPAVRSPAAARRQQQRLAAGCGDRGACRDGPQSMGGEGGDGGGGNGGGGGGVWG